MDKIPNEVCLFIVQHLHPLDLLRLICAVPFVVDILRESTILAATDAFGNTALHLIADASVLTDDTDNDNDNDQPQSAQSHSRSRREGSPEWRTAWHGLFYIIQANGPISVQTKSRATRLPSKKVAIWLMSRFLANRNIDVNVTNDDGNPPLTIAIIRDRRDIMKMILADARTNPNLRSKADISPLCQAAYNEREEMVEFLLADYRVDVNNWSEDGIPWTLLDSRKGNNIFKRVLETEGVIFELHDMFSERWLFQAAEILHDIDETARAGGEHDTNMLETLMVRRGLDVVGTGLFLTAAKMGNVEMFGYLLEREDIKEHLEENGMVVLTDTSLGYESIMSMLLAHENISGYFTRNRN